MHPKGLWTYMASIYMSLKARVFRLQIYHSTMIDLRKIFSCLGRVDQSTSTVEQPCISLNRFLDSWKPLTFRSDLGRCRVPIICELLKIKIASKPTYTTGIRIPKQSMSSANWKTLRICHGHIFFAEIPAARVNMCEAWAAQNKWAALRSPAGYSDAWIQKWANYHHTHCGMEFPSRVREYIYIYLYLDIDVNPGLKQWRVAWREVNYFESPGQIRQGIVTGVVWLSGSWYWRTRRLTTWHSNRGACRPQKTFSQPQPAAAAASASAFAFVRAADHGWQAAPLSSLTYSLGLLME